MVETAVAVAVDAAAQANGNLRYALRKAYLSPRDSSKSAGTISNCLAAAISSTCVPGVIHLTVSSDTPMK